MKKTRFIFAILLLSAASTVCAAGPKSRVVGRVTAPPLAAFMPTGAPWTIEITSSGGITGMGSGNVRVTSEGGKIAIGVFKPNQCEFTLPAADVMDLEEFVKSLRPDLWYGSYVPAETRLLCCDLIALNVKVTRREVSRADGHEELGVYETNLLAHPVALSIPKDLTDLVTKLYYAVDNGSYLQRYRCP